MRSAAAADQAGAVPEAARARSLRGEVGEAGGGVRCHPGWPGNGIWATIRRRRLSSTGGGKPAQARCAGPTLLLGAGVRRCGARVRLREAGAELCGAGARLRETRAGLVEPRACLMRLGAGLVEFHAEPVDASQSDCGAGAVEDLVAAGVLRTWLLRLGAGLMGLRAWLLRPEVWLLFLGARLLRLGACLLCLGAGFAGVRAWLQRLGAGLLRVGAGLARVRAGLLRLGTGLLRLGAWLVWLGAWLLRLGVWPAGMRAWLLCLEVWPAGMKARFVGLGAGLAGVGAWLARERGPRSCRGVAGGGAVRGEMYPGHEAVEEVGRRVRAVRGEVEDGLAQLGRHVDRQHRRTPAELGEQQILGVGTRPRLSAGRAIPGRPLPDVVLFELVLSVHCHRRPLFAVHFPLSICGISDSVSGRRRSVASRRVFARRRCGRGSGLGRRSGRSQCLGPASCGAVCAGQGPIARTGDCWSWSNSSCHMTSCLVSS